MTTDKIATNATYALSGGGSLWAYFTFNEWIALAGLTVALATFAVNAVFKWLHYRLEKGKAVRIHEKGRQG